MRRFLTLFAVFAAIQPQVAFAQYSPPVFIGNWDYTSGSVQLMNDELVRESTVQSMLSRQSGNAFSMQNAPSSYQASPSRGTAKDLIFRMSPEDRKHNVANFIEKARSVDPTGAAQMRQIFDSVDVFGSFEAAMAPYGLKTNNVADAYAIYWIAAWEASRGIDSSTETRARITAVKRQVVDALTATPTFVTATPAQKQEFAEALLIQAALVQATVSTYSTDPVMMKKVAASVKVAAREMGLDLDMMTLTEQGFKIGGK